MLFYIKIDIVSWIIFIGWWFINYFPLENLIIFEDTTVTALRKKKKKEPNLKCTYHVVPIYKFRSDLGKIFNWLWIVPFISGLDKH